MSNHAGVRCIYHCPFKGTVALITFIVLYQSHGEPGQIFPLNLNKEGRVGETSY